MDDLLKQMESELEEYGQFHEGNCDTYNEDECNCDMYGMKSFVKEQMEKVNAYWIGMAEAHRPYCKPEGNKMLTRMMGKKNRNLKSVTTNTVKE